jgi:hypothetical protein
MKKYNETHETLDYTTRRAIAHAAAGRRYRDRQCAAKRLARKKLKLDENLMEIRIEAMRRAKQLWFSACNRFELPDDHAKRLRLPGD